MFPILFSGESPSDIPNLKAWYDATTINQADGTSVTAWLDQSGNEAHMYQSTTAAQPTLQTNELNGRPVVRFDGTDDFMNLTAPFDVTPTSNSSVDVCKFSPSGQYVIHLNGGTSPYIFIYKKNGNVYNKLDNPATLPTGTVYGCSWSPDSTYLVINHATTPYITIYKRSGDTFVKLSNPASIPNFASSSSGWSNDGNYLAIAGPFSSPAMRLYVYKRSGDVFTKIANPVILPAGGDARQVKFSTNDSFLALANGLTPFIYFYSFNKSTDTLTKLNDPITLPANEVLSISWLNDEYCAVGFASSTMRFYKFNGTNFEEDTNLNTNMSAVYSIEYSKSGKFMAIGGQFSPFIKIYSISGNVYTQLTNSLSLPTNQARGVSFNNDDTSFVVSQISSPFIQAYTFDGTTLTNLTKLNMFQNVGGASVFVVAKYAISGAFSQSSFAATVNTSSGSSRVYTGQQAATTKYMTGGRRLDADSFQSTLSTTTTTGGYILQTGVTDYNNSNQYIYINGKLETSNLSFQTDGLTSNTNSLAVYLGNIATEWLNGDIAEVIVYNRTLSDNEIKMIHQYLSKKWGIALVP